jgi:anti-anti-sigma factor
VPVPGDFDVSAHRRGSAVVVAPAGEIDLATIGLVADAVEEGHDRGSALVIDLREVRFLDGSGLRYLLQLRDRAQQDGFDLALVRGPAAVQRVFQTLGLEDQFPFVDQPDAALMRDG